MKKETEYSISNGWPFLMCLSFFILLSCFGECNAQSYFNTYSVTDSVDIAFVEDDTRIDLTEEAIYVINDEYLFKDVITSVDVISSSKKIYYTESGDQFIFIGFEGDIHQVKWIGHYPTGGMITFFNTNKKN